MREARRRLEALLVPQPDGRGVEPEAAAVDGRTRIWSTRWRNTSSSKPVEKQALLERDGLLERCRSLIELLEMKVIVSRHKWGGEGARTDGPSPSRRGGYRFAAGGAGRYSICTLLTIATGRPGAAASRPAAVVASSTSPSRLTCSTFAGMVID